MEPFDVAVAFRVMIRRPSMRDAQPCERFQEPRGSELRSVVRRQHHVFLAAARGEPFDHGLFRRYGRVFNTGQRDEKQQLSNSTFAKSRRCSEKQLQT